MAKRVAARTPKPASKRIDGDINAERDAILGDQFNIVVNLLAQPATAIRVERDTNGEAVIVIGADDGGARLTPADVDAFRALYLDPDPTIREQAYLTRFILDHTYAQWERGYLPLAGRIKDAPLRMTDRADPDISGAGEPLPDIREALGARGKTKLVILGAPGAGKTTTLERLALDLARARLRDPAGMRLPFRVDLFEFTTADPNPEAFLRDKWANQCLAHSYGEAVAAGQVCFLLDGLNQMPLADRNARLERWSHWARTTLPPGNWAVFTCRVADYTPNLLLPEVRVQELDEGWIREYLTLRLGPEHTVAVWQDFSRRLRSADDRFERLARNPFMLAQLVDRAEKGLALTDNRAELMDDLARDLLDRELSFGRQPVALTQDKVSTLDAALDALGRLAYEMQLSGEGTGLKRSLAEAVPLVAGAPFSVPQVLKLATSATVLELAEGRDNEDDAVYAFYHHLLQEYFAARDLIRRFKSGEDLAPRWRVAWMAESASPYDPANGEALPPAEVTGWEETVILAAALCAQEAPRLAPRLIEAVRDGNLPLAGRCLAAAGAQRETLAPLVSPLRVALLGRQRDPGAGLRARIEAGLSLGDVGHPDLLPQAFTFEGRTVVAILPPMQPVPAGDFIRGSDPTDTSGYSDEYTSERTVTLPAFSIGRYPVTNAEFKYFVDDPGGYAADRWWDDAGLRWKAGGPDAHAGLIERWLANRKWLTEDGVEKNARARNWAPARQRYWQKVVALSDDDAREWARRTNIRQFDRPAYWDVPERSRPSQPVVGVNWHEANAYCRWLSAVSARAFQLPSEAQWEKAARGVDGREYPWGDAHDAALCNTVESRIDSTIPVGLFPGGTSPHGLFDAGGNVWEWTADWYMPYPGGDPVASKGFGETHRCVRGGAWHDSHRNARCASRSWDVPEIFGSGLGFRAISPSSS